MKKFNYTTTRDAAKKVFTAIITKPVAGQNIHYIAPDLSNVLAMVAVSDSGQIVAHKHDEEALKDVDFNTSVKYLAKDAKDLSVAFDSGVFGDSVCNMAEDARFVEGEEITYYMDIDAVSNFTS